MNNLDTNTQYETITTKELKELRSTLHQAQDGICPIMAISIPLENMVIDHQHRRNKEEAIGNNGAGLIRGAIQRHANALEGKITNNWRRYGMDKFDISLSDFLRNLADYLDRDNFNIIHPSEMPKPKIVTKSSYNRLKKAVGDRQSFPEYRTRKTKKTVKNAQKLTKPLKALFEKYEIKWKFY